MSRTKIQSAQGLEARWVLVTPALAGKWLGKNSNNRPLRNQVVGILAGDMAAGRWRDNGDPIRWGADGVLQDGQHRLAAIVESDSSQELLIVGGLAAGAFESIDGGIKRTVADGLRGVQNASALAAAGRLIWLQEHHGGILDRSHAVSKAEILAFIRSTPSIAESVAFCVSAPGEGVDRIFGSACFVAYFVHYTRLSHPERLASFLRGIGSRPDGLSVGQPTFALRERIHEEKARGAVGLKPCSPPLRSLFVRAWRAHRDGRRLTKLLLPKNLVFTSVDLDPRL
jgi:hypothetical protein